MRAQPAKVTVRRAEIRDAESLMATHSMPRAMAGTLQLPFPSVDAWRKRIGENSADDYVLVAEADGVLVGSLGLHPSSRSPRRRHAAGIGMSVHDDWQRRGVGTTLLRAAIDLADKWLNYRRLELTVYTDNVAALALYSKFDFEIEGTLRDYAFRDGHFVDAYTMARVRSESRKSVVAKDTTIAKTVEGKLRVATRTARKR